MIDPNLDFEDEQPTPKIDSETMEQLMNSLLEETAHSPGIPTLTSERPTKPMRPIVMERVRGEEER